MLRRLPVLVICLDSQRRGTWTLEIKATLEAIAFRQPYSHSLAESRSQIMSAKLFHHSQQYDGTASSCTSLDAL